MQSRFKRLIIEEISVKPANKTATGIKDIVYNQMDINTLMLANSWITGSFAQYNSTMRDDVYKWLSEHPDDDIANSILGAYVVKQN